MTEDNEETLSDGKKVVRDASGRFKKVELSSERAKELQELGAEAKRTKRATVEELLTEAGFVENVPEYVALMAQQACKSHVAMQHWRQFCGFRSEHEVVNSEGHLRVPLTGEVCPLCKREDSKTYLDRLLDIVGEHEETEAGKT